MEIKKIMVIAAAALMAGGLASCGSKNSPQPETSTSTSQPTTTDTGTGSSSSEGSSSTSEHVHSYGEWTVTAEETCTTDGSRERKCAECGVVQEEKIPAAHKINEYTGACTREGCDHIASWVETLETDWYTQNNELNLYRGDTASFKLHINATDKFKFTFEDPNNYITAKIFNRNSEFVCDAKNVQFELQPGDYFASFENGDIDDVLNTKLEFSCVTDVPGETGLCENCGAVVSTATELFTSDLSTFSSETLTPGKQYGFMLCLEDGDYTIQQYKGLEGKIEWFDQSTRKLITSYPEMVSCHNGSNWYYDLRITPTKEGKFAITKSSINFVGVVTSARTITGRGTAVTVTLLNDIAVSDSVKIRHNNGSQSIEDTVITVIGKGDSAVASASAGDTVEIVLRGVSLSDTLIGSIITKN